MYDTQHALYALKLTDFVKQVSGVFILNGAYCTISNTSTGSSSQATSTIINSAGFSYVSQITLPSIQTVTEDSLRVEFTFFKKYEKKLREDVHGEIVPVGDKFLLHIKNEVKIVDLLSHDDFGIRLTQKGPLTLEILRDILGKVRAMYLLDGLDKLNDVLPVPSTNTEKDNVLNEIKRYLKMVVDKGYLFDLCTKSTTDLLDKKLITLSIHKKDGSKASRDVVSMELFARKYEPAIILSIDFSNDKDPFKGEFLFIDAGIDPYVISKNLNIDEADYFIKGIQRVCSEINYHYVVDVTP